MKRRNLIYGFIVALGAVLLWAGAFGLQAPAQSVPPLGDVVRTFDAVTMPQATAYSVYTSSAAVPHQVWYRVSGGDALFRQRLRIYQENASPRPTNQLPPDTELHQEITTNTPTRWFSFPQERGIFTYYFDGDNRVTNTSPWRDAFGIRVRRTRYTNGNLYQIGFEDNESLDDYNDLEIEVVILQPA